MNAISLEKAIGKSIARMSAYFVEGIDPFLVGRRVVFASAVAKHFNASEIAMDANNVLIPASTVDDVPMGDGVQALQAS